HARLRDQNSLIRSLPAGGRIWTTYVSERVVTAYVPSAAVGRQMRPVGKGVSTHTSAVATGAPSVVVTFPRICGPGSSVTSIERSRPRSTTDVATPSSRWSYHCATSRTLSGGTTQRDDWLGSRGARYDTFHFVILLS